VLLNEETWSRWPEASPGAHQVSPLLAVRLFRQLYPEATTRILLVGLCVSKIELGNVTGTKAGGPSAESIAAGARMAHELL
jgi:hypothetical protein